jgi:nucleoside-diphosphate-sugar epimerase
MILRMRILVIGGQQFMGREIVLRLAARGHDVSVVHRHGAHDLGAGIGNLNADRGNAAAMSKAIEGHAFDAVVDMVYDWQNGTTADQVQATAGLFGDRLERYVFMSSVAAYGVRLGCREEDALAPDDHPNDYFAHKASSERALFRMHADTGFPVTTFRPPFVYGPRQPFDREQFFWDRLLDGRPIILPDGEDAPMQWGYSGDVADAVARSLEVPDASGQAFNVGHHPGTRRSFIETLARIAGVTPEFAAIPRDAILAAGGHAVMGNLYFGQYLDIPPITTVIEKTPRMLGIEPLALEDGLRATWAWYSAQPRRPRDYSFEDRLLAL